MRRRRRVHRPSNEKTNRKYAADPEWRRRLDREARAVSSLSHPDVCPLFDVGHQDGIDFLVMEYLERETLAARLQRGALPGGRALKPERLLEKKIDVGGVNDMLDRMTDDKTSGFNIITSWAASPATV